MSHIDFVTTSEHRFKAYVFERYYDDALDKWIENAIDLTGATVTLRYSVNGVAEVSKSLTPDADQVTNKGWAQYDFLIGDLTVAGEMTLTLDVLVGGKTYRSKQRKKADVRTHLVV